MIRGSIQFAAGFAALLIGAVVGAALGARLFSVSGDPVSVVSLAASPAVAAGLTVGIICTALLLSTGIARLGAPTGGLLCGGFCLAAFAFQHDGASPDPGLARLAIETAAWGAVVLFLSVMTDRAHREDDIEGCGTKPAWTLIGFAGACLIVLPVVGIIARSTMKGQLLAAVTIGAMLSALAIRLAFRTMPRPLIIVSTMFAGLAGYLGAELFPDRWSVFVHIMPQDYAAGSLLGGSIGIGWAASFFATEEEPAADLAPKTG